LRVLLRREGWKVNIKCVSHLYKLEGSGAQTKKRKKRASHLGVIPNLPDAAERAPENKHRPHSSIGSSPRPSSLPP
jgi:hypothetical protein